MTWHCEGSSLLETPFCFIVYIYISETSMYLPVAPITNRHRRSLNLLEVPHPQPGPQAKQPEQPEQPKASSVYVFSSV